MKRKRVRKPKDLHGRLNKWIGPSKIAWVYRESTKDKGTVVSGMCFGLTGTKRLHAWLGRAIKYLEQTEGKKR